MRALVAFTALLIFAGCGGSSEPGEPAAGTAPSLGHPAPGGGLTIDEALETDAEPPLLVRGYVVGRGGDVRFCALLRESHPPQCGGASLALEGLEQADVGELRRAEGVMWTENEVALLGELHDGRFRVSSTATA